MNDMKKILALALVFTGILSSCDSNIDERPYDPTATLNTTLLAKTDQSFDDGTVLTTNYNYEGYKLANLTNTAGGAMVFFYNGNNIVKIETYQDNVLTTVDYFGYSNAGQMTSHKKELPQSNTATREDFTYAGDVASYQTFFGTIESQTTPDVSGKLYITSGEVVKKEVFVNGELSSSETFTYDQKNNPLRNAIGVSRAFMFMGNIQGIMHNLLFTSGTTNPKEISYNFNTNDYPRSSVTNSALDGQTATVYTYE